MGDESKKNELKRGNTDPLHAPRKPSTAREVEDKPSEMAQMPSAEEVARRDREGTTGKR